MYIYIYDIAMLILFFFYRVSSASAHYRWGAAGCCRRATPTSPTSSAKVRVSLNQSIKILTKPITGKEKPIPTLPQG